MQTTENTTQPKQLYMLFFAEMWERFSFYGMRALLVLYLTKDLFDKLGEGIAKDKAFGIYAAYGALVYATPFLGGILADKILGYKKSVLLGGVLMAIGHFVMAIETEFFLYLALSFLIVGNGFFKPNVSSIVGGLYADNDPRRDGGFTIFYMGINLGAFLAPLACGYLGEQYGWSWGFGLAGIGMLLGLIVFWRGQDSLGENGEIPNTKTYKSFGMLTYIGAFASVVLFFLLVKYHDVASYILAPFAIGVILFILGYALVKVFSNDTENNIEGQRLLVVVIMLFFTTLFWAFFEQAGSSLTTFANENVDRTLWSWNVPVTFFQALNPCFIVILAPLFSMFWLYLNRKKSEPNTPVKFSLGLFQLGLGFLVLMFGAQFVSVVDGQVLVPVIFLVLAYLLHTTGELCLSPVGLSMVTKLASKKIMAMVMGAWFLSSSLAHIIAGSIAKFTNSGQESNANLGTRAIDFGLLTEEQLSTTNSEILQSFDNLAVYSSVFNSVGFTAIGSAVFLLMLSPLIKKWMNGVH